MNVGLYEIKPWFVRRLRYIEDALVARRVSANLLSAGAVAISVLTGVAVGFGGFLGLRMLWLVVPVLVLARLGLNALDGSVARRSRASNPVGPLVNEVSDRLADAAMLAPIALVAPPALAFGALSAALLTSTTGVVAQALTGARDNTGPMGKADRCAVVAVASVAGVATGSNVPFAWACWLVIAGSLVTASARVIRLRRALESDPAAIHMLQNIDAFDLGVGSALANVVEFPQPVAIEEDMLHGFGR